MDDERVLGDQKIWGPGGQRWVYHKKVTTRAIAVSNTSSGSLAMSMSDKRKLWNLNRLGDQRWGAGLWSDNLGRSLYQIQAGSLRDVLGHCCIKYKQQVQVRRRELEVQVGWSWWSNDNQTTFVWHVTVDRGNSQPPWQLELELASSHPRHRYRSYSIQRFFTLSNCHTYLIQWSPSGSASTRTSATTRYR